MELSALGEMALGYARLGLPVLPEHELLPDGRCSCGCPYERCWRRAKHPRIRNWERRASTDEALIRRWWGRWPNANIGLGVGQGGLVVLDLDIRPGAGDPREALADRFGRSALDTLTSETGSGGYHLFFRLPPGTKIQTRKDILGPGLDVQAAEGLCTIPPSIHPNGTPYRWLEGLGPGDRALAILPPALVAQLSRRPSPFWYARMAPYWAADHLGLSHPMRERLRRLESRLHGRGPRDG